MLSPIPFHWACEFRDGARFRRYHRTGSAAGLGRARELYDEFRPASFFSFHANASAMRLKNLIDDCEAQARASDKPRLERLEEARGFAWDQGRRRYRGIEIRTQSALASRPTEERPPSGMARSALLHRFHRTCFIASRSARARHFLLR